MKVAFATDDGVHVNSHFGFCETFAIYEVTPGKYEKQSDRHVSTAQGTGEAGRIDARVSQIRDCTLLFITAIGPSAAARVTTNNIMPIKVEDGTTIIGQLEKLMEMLKNRPPLWLAKAINTSQLKEEVR